MILHEVITTEKVPFHYRVAGMGSRFLAWLVDAGAIVLLATAGAMAGGVLESAKPGLGTGLVVIWVFWLTWGYFLLFEWLWHGQTPGKRMLGIRVIRLEGTGVSFFQSAARNLLRIIDSLPLFYGLGFAVAACNRENRRLGDLAAGTLVVHVDRKARPIRALHDEGTDLDRVRESLIRQRATQLDREQKQALLDLCLRRDQLEIHGRARLFTAIADFLGNKLKLVADQYQSDEKFILQVAGILGERGPVESDPVPVKSRGWNSRTAGT